MKKFIIYWSPILIYCLLIYVQSSYPSPKGLPQWHFFDKFLHVTAYALLSALFLRAFKTTRIKYNLKLVLILSVLLSSLYGISDEIHQSFVPYRTADYMDVLADIIGSIIGVYIYQTIVNKISYNK